MDKITKILFPQNKHLVLQDLNYLNDQKESNLDENMKNQVEKIVSNLIRYLCKTDVIFSGSRRIIYCFWPTIFSKGL